MCNEITEFLNNGYYIYFLCPKGKYVREEPDCCKAVNSRNKFEELLTKYPDSNFGLGTSLWQGGIVVIDIDIKNGIDGDLSLRKFFSEKNLTLPKTATVKTGSGGYHYYFKNETNIKIYGMQNVLPGIDVRAEGAYAVIPPSTHSNGETYRWYNSSFDDISPLTDGVIELLELIPDNIGLSYKIKRNEMLY